MESPESRLTRRGLLKELVAGTVFLLPETPQSLLPQGSNRFFDQTTIIIGAFSAGCALMFSAILAIEEKNRPALKARFIPVFTAAGFAMGVGLSQLLKVYPPK